MLATILRRVAQQLLMLLVVSILLLAAYVSAGRQFMPAIDRYSGFLEEQIFEMTGLPVTIDSINGSFEGFNPLIRINGLRFAVTQTAAAPAIIDSSALVFGSATIIVDMSSSIWQRRWVLEDFVIESLQINIEQNDAGSWQLSGVNVAGGAPVALNDIFQATQRFSTLSLNDVVVNVRTRAGNDFTLNNGSATIQNQGSTHYLHMNANLEQSLPQILLSFEVEGDDLAEVDGQIHVQLPVADYSNLLRGEIVADFVLDELIGGGDLWIDLEQGGITGGVTRADIDMLVLSGEQPLPIILDDFSGTVALGQGEEPDHWRLMLADMAVDWEDHFWRPFNAYLYWAPDRSLEIRADNIDLALLTEVALSSGLLEDEAQQQLAQYAPSGMLENFSLYLPFAEASDRRLTFRSNISGAQVGSVNGSPNMSGVSGYAEFDYDTDNRLVTGLAEVESTDFSINLPNLFTSVWDYSFVNGRLDFLVDLNDGSLTKLVSGPIVAQSEIIDGRALFTSTDHRRGDGSRQAELEVLVGIKRLDAAYKSLYIPDGPRIDDDLRGSMEWLEGALLDGEMRNSAAIYRGLSHPGAPRLSKTFQSFFRMQDGEVNFSDEWPELQQLDAIVSTDDSVIDVELKSGRSLGLGLSSMSGTVRPDEDLDNWLQIESGVGGATAAGLNYLQQAPISEEVKAAFADWQAVGDFSGEINVRMPLGDSSPNTSIHLDIDLEDNHINIPSYALELDQVSGPVRFDSFAGLEYSELQARLFDRPVTFSLSSEAQGSVIQSIHVDAVGGATQQALMDWPLQSDFVRKILSRMEGEIEYRASLSLPQQRENQDSEQLAHNSLLLDTDLVGATLSLPAPFDKPADSALPLQVQLLFDEDQTVSGSFGEDVVFNLSLSEDGIQDGTVLLGQSATDAPVEDEDEEEEANGLTVSGDLEIMRLEEWTDFLFATSDSGSPAADLSESVAFVEIDVETFELYGQELAEVGIRIEPDLIDQGWLTRVSGDALQGWVTIPYDSEDYLVLDMEHIRLPGDDEEFFIDDPDTITTRVMEPEAEEMDVLADIDPRSLPAIQLKTGEFSIGTSPYGSWQFTLDPTDEGADFGDLAFDFRGLRVALDEDPEPDEDTDPALYDPHFRWLYDGDEHRSEFRGIIHVGDIADVLTANGYAASLESANGIFLSQVDWPGSPAFFAASTMSGDIELQIDDGRFLQDSGGPGALKLISIINLDAIMRRLRFSDDLLRSGLAYDEISASVQLEDGLVNIIDRLVISGPSSLYQITGEIDLQDESVSGEMYVTLPVSNNIPWLGVVTGNLPLAVGAYLFDRIFGEQVDSLTSAVYTLEGPWEGLEPQFKQAFGSPDTAVVQ